MSPERPPLPWMLRWPGLALAAAITAAYHGADGELAALLGADARGAMAEFAGGFWPPAHSPDLLASLARPLAETVAIALLGLGLAVALAAPLAYLAVSPAALATPGRTPSPARRLACAGARALLGVMRSVPEIVWALVLVRAVGLGPAAGVVAIGVAYAGVVGKVFAEIFEATPRRPADALLAAGASPLRAFAFATLPSSLPLVASYTLYRFDCALRASAVLGLVGAGGVGARLELSLRMLSYDEAATVVLALFALVAAVDLLSQLARARIRESRGVFPGGARGLAAGGVAFAALCGGAAAFLDLPLRELLSAAPARSLARFAAASFPPDLDGAFLRQLAPAVVETLAISVLGTALAAAAGLLLAYPAASRGHLAAGGPPRPPARRALAAAVAWVARGILNLARTLPELVWALLVIFAVGLGPFAGALALAVHTAGVLGRLYAEALEEVPAAPVAALRSAGAGDAGATLFAVLPQAFPQLASYTLYRWEVNIRASAVLGVVGAGGIGSLLHVSLSLFQERRTLTLLLVIVALVTAVDLASGALRRRILEGGAPRASARGAEVPPAAAGAVEAY